MDKNKTTKDIFSINGEYSEKRKSIHKEIVQMFISDKGFDHEVEGRVGILLGGGSGVGKSRIINKIIGTNGYVLVDPDEIKKLLPEYREAIKLQLPEAADIVHEESSDIAQLLLDECIERYEPFIYDGTMKNLVKYKRIINELQSRDYSIQIIIVDADVEIAYDRVKKRYFEDWRFVGRDIVEQTNYLVAKSFQELYNLVDMYSVFENNSNTEDPKIIAYRDTEQEEVVLDDIAYNEFLQKSSLV